MTNSPLTSGVARQRDRSAKGSSGTEFEEAAAESLLAATAVDRRADRGQGVVGIAVAAEKAEEGGADDKRAGDTGDAGRQQPVGRRGSWDQRADRSRCRIVRHARAARHSRPANCRSVPLRAIKIPIPLNSCRSPRRLHALLHRTRWCAKRSYTFDLAYRPAKIMPRDTPEICLPIAPSQPDRACRVDVHPAIGLTRATGM